MRMSNRQSGTSPLPYGKVVPCRWRSLWLRQDAQSLLELALVLPIFVALACYAVDFGYFFLVAASLSSSARTSIEYSVQGFPSVAQSPLPATSSVAALLLEDLSSLVNSATVTSVELCSTANGASGAVTCTSSGASTLSYVPDTDPESPLFHLQRVDVVYAISPPIPLTFPGGVLNLIPTQFHRMVEMRSVGP